MAYNLNLVQMIRPPNNFSAPMLLKNASLSGFPSGAFNYLLFSEWVCLGTTAGSIVVSNIVTFFEVAINNNSIQVVLKDGLTSLINKSYPATIQNFRSNILVSVDTQHQILQIYINDAPIVVPITDWIANGSFSIGQGFSNWDIGAAGSSGGPTPSLADVYINAPNGFYDLSVEANRRKFINADLTPVDLGTQGNGPTGSQPQIWLNANSGNPNDFATNFGFGGAFNQAFTPFVYQAANVCVLPVPTHIDANINLIGVEADFAVTAPIVITGTTTIGLSELEVTDIELSFTTPVIPDDKVTLRWSDDAGASWSNGLLRSMGQAGEYFTSPTWYRLGMARNRILELSWSGAQAEALQGVFVEVTIAAT